MTMTERGVLVCILLAACGDGLHGTPDASQCMTGSCDGGADTPPDASCDCNDPACVDDACGRVCAPDPVAHCANGDVQTCDDNGQLHLVTECNTEVCRDAACIPNSCAGTLLLPGVPWPSVGARPVSVATGDFNGDGKLDLVVASHRGFTVDVVLGTGAGTYSPAVKYVVGQPVGVVVGDFNGDGKLDLAVANAGPTEAVSLLIGSGTGTFASQVGYAAGSRATSLTAGDFNGDGKLDLAVADDSGNLNVLLNTGGGFGAPASQAVGAMPRAVATGDFNGDGNLDLAVANNVDNNVSVLLGNGTGAFAAAVNYAAGTGPASIVTADVDGDTKLDLVVANEGSSNVSVLLGTGTGTFGAAANVAAGDAPVSMTIADLNRDGRLDLVVANRRQGTVSVLLGDGAGAFGTASSYASGDSPEALTIGDLDGDGTLDLAVANSGGCGPSSQPSGELCASIAVLLGSGAGTFAAVVTFPGSIVSLGTADFDGDGNLDLFGTGGGALRVLLGSSTGVFGPPASYPVVAFPTVITSMVPGDFNGDGKPDLAVGITTVLLIDGALPRGASTLLLLNKGDGTFAAPNGITNDGQPVAAGDFDGNGTIDLVLAGDVLSSAVTVLLGTGTGAFISTPPSNAGLHVAGALVTDFDGDGKLDLIVPAGLMRGNGDGTLRSPLSLGDGIPKQVIGDFNGDGKPDLAGADYYNNRVLVVLSTGDGTFGDVIDYPVGASPLVAEIGDVNGDHSLDLIVANSGSGTASVLVNNGLGTFAAAVDYPIGTFPGGLAVGDFDRDGRLDVVAVDTNSGRVSVAFNRGCR